MKVLIIGCGYVGLALGKELRLRGHEVWGVRRSDAARAELERAGITPVVADITKVNHLTSLPRGCEWVVNCASASGGDTKDYRRVYFHGNRNVLESLASSPPKKFVYTSSTGVYTQQEGSVVDETTEVPKGTAKTRVLVETEELLLQAARDKAFPAVILRVAGIYGPQRGYWLKLFLAGAAVIEGAGSRRLNMVHRDDVVGAIICALEHGKAGEVYNAVDDEPPTQLAVFEWLSQRTGRTLPAAALPALSGAPRRRTATNKIVSNRKLRTELGWHLKYPTFREGYEAELRREGLL